ncbi:NUDIX domain-containing protein [Marinitenerispora sediminis]|uniref:NUDIX hydrolase n=1 Tax=Marinitenerispora sediminis TaxID=1931232 RepID=A0A368T6Z5_9ACTN|nr:NUDIX domain-containing protein [Marinitenerispora sediminis]RCV49723.1 NUDIX hydrolase [Marinitenerispora sediminis]RCV59270.1 NUDIX hydrolase [Marinitenerispora sediminis]
MKRCCGSSIGVIIRDEHGRYLMIERGWWPVGHAPVAGHVYDQHADPVAAALAEVEEEVGLTVVDLKPVLGPVHLPNLCASLPAEPTPGHTWWVVEATVTGTLRPAEGETKGARWYTPGQVQALAQRTIDHARGVVGTEEFTAHPGLEAVWIDLLHRASHLEVAEEDLLAARELYTAPPPEHWLGGRR